MLSILFTVFLLGFSSNPSLKGVKTVPGGALVDINLFQFDEAPARQALPRPSVATRGERALPRIILSFKRITSTIDKVNRKKSRIRARIRNRHL
jgi:hypothetical protein